MFAKCTHIFQNKTYWDVDNSLEPAAVCIVFQIYYCSCFVYLSVETQGLQYIVVLLAVCLIHHYNLWFQTPAFFSGDHSGVVYTYIASHNWIKDSQLLSNISQCTIYAYMLYIEMKTRKWKIVMVRVMLSKEQVHFILISMCLSSCLSFTLSPYIHSDFLFKHE